MATPKNKAKTSQPYQIDGKIVDMQCKPGKPIKVVFQCENTRTNCQQIRAMSDNLVVLEQTQLEIPATVENIEQSDDGQSDIEDA